MIKVFTATIIVTAVLTICQQKTEKVINETPAQVKSVSELDADVSNEVEPGPAIESLKQLSGTWRRTTAYGGSPLSKSDGGSESRFWEELTERSDSITVSGNYLCASECYRAEGAHIALDFSGMGYQPFGNQKLSNDGTLILLTLDDGKALLASYVLSESSLTIRYPAGCCSRSGLVVTLERVEPESDK